jgi:hypothetical protein
MSSPWMLRRADGQKEIASRNRRISVSAKQIILPIGIIAP